MIWCGVSTNATAMDEYGAYLKQNSDAITAIAPTIWHLAHDSQSLTADDAIMAATAKLKKQSGVRVIPTVFDNESYNQGTLKPRLLKLFANPHKFINAIVNASVFYDFDGVNLDFEPRWKASPSDRAGLLNFVNELSDAMHKVGKVVSIDAAPCVNPSWQGVKWQNNCMWCAPHCRCCLLRLRLRLCVFAELLLPGRWDMADYNESRVDSFCNMFTYSNWTSLFTRELMDDLVRHTTPAPEPSLRCLTSKAAAVRTILGRTSTRSGWGWTRSTARRSPTRSWRFAST